MSGPAAPALTRIPGSELIAEDCRQFAIARNFIAANRKNTGTTSESTGHDLVNDAIGSGVIFFREGNGACLIINKTGNYRINVDEERVDRAIGCRPRRI